MNEREFNEKIGNNIRKYRLMYNANGGYMSQRELAEKIRLQWYIYKGHPNTISDTLKNVEKKLGIPLFSIHKLRHYFASQMSALGVPEADILKMGGWESDHIMKSVYRHSMMEKQEKAKRDASEKLRKTLFS